MDDIDCKKSLSSLINIRQSALLVIIAVLIFVIINLFSVLVIVILWIITPSDLSTVNSSPVQFEVVPGNVNLTDFYVEVVENTAAPFKRELLNEFYGKNCRERFELLGQLDSGWTKKVHRARSLLSGEMVAIKQLHNEGHDMRQCALEGLQYHQCYIRSAKKILRELVLLLLLRNNRGVIQVRHWCLSNNQFFIATELGSPLDLFLLLQMPWDRRLQIAMDLSQLLVTLHSGTSLGSMAIRDLRREQFILTLNHTLKLVDLDDIHMKTPTCSSEECAEQLSQNFILRSPCHEGRCSLHNQLANLYKAQHHFFSYLLQHGAPKSLFPMVNNIRQYYNSSDANCIGLSIQIRNLYAAYRKEPKGQRVLS